MVIQYICLISKPQKMNIITVGNRSRQIREIVIWPHPFHLILTNKITPGYGSLYPDRDLGKMVGIFYALVGIPLMLCFLNVCCDALSSCVSVLIRLTSRRIGLRNPILLFIHGATTPHESNQQTQSLELRGYLKLMVVHGPIQ